MTKNEIDELRKKAQEGQELLKEERKDLEELEQVRNFLFNKKHKDRTCVENALQLADDCAFLFIELEDSLLKNKELQEQNEKLRAISFKFIKKYYDDSKK